MDAVWRCSIREQTLGNQSRKGWTLFLIRCTMSTTTTTTILSWPLPVFVLSLHSPGLRLFGVTRISGLQFPLGVEDMCWGTSVFAQVGHTTTTRQAISTGLHHCEPCSFHFFFICSKRANICTGNNSGFTRSYRGIEATRRLGKQANREGRRTR